MPYIVPILQKATRIPITQMEYTLTHQKTEQSQIHGEDDPYGVPNKHLTTQTVFNIRHTSEPIGKNVKIALCAHKRALTSDTRQNQLAKHPNDTSCSKENFAGCTPVDLLGLGARQLVQRHLSIPPRKSIHWQPVPTRRETGRGPQINGLSSC